MHLINDNIWGFTDPSDVSIDTVYATEIIASSHTIEEATYTCCKPDSYELFHMTVSVPYKDDESWFDTLESLDNYNEWNKPLSTDCVHGVTVESTNKCIKPDLYIGKRQS